MKLMIWVQHLRGIGHVMRALEIAKAARAKGMDVLLVSGNSIPDVADTKGISIATLPPCRALDDTFTTFIDEVGAPLSDAWWHNRSAELQQVFNGYEPDILLTETYPFGRRPFHRELDPIIAAMRERNGLVISSVRDILQTVSRPQKAKWIIARAQTFDHILIHGDERLARLEDSFPTEQVNFGRTSYTGFVGSKSEAPTEGLPRGELIVSVGGGAMGGALLSSIPGAVRDGPPSWRWRIFHGALAEPGTIARLQAIASDRVIVEAGRSDFAARLHHAKASISLCGYNTTMDILAAGVPAVMVPFDDAGQTEQVQRAEALAALSRVKLVKPANLSGPKLVDAIKEAISDPVVSLDFNLDGATSTANLLSKIAEARRSGT